MAVVIYARKSTESEDRQIQSLDDQLLKLRELAKREGIQISEELVEAKSAKEPGTRPVFQHLIDLVQQGSIEGILTWQINRLSRNLVDGGLIAHLLQSGKLRYIKTPERTFTSDDSALLMAIETGVATSFIQDLRRNVKRGMDGKARRGWRPTRAPLGYVNNRLLREIEPDPDRFEVLKHGWEMLATGGYSIADICRELRKMGLTGAESSRPISLSRMYAIFRNRFYCGQFPFNGEIMQGRHTPMVSVENFEAVQRQLGTHMKVRDPELKHSFAGIFRCGTCGCSITAETRVKVYKTTCNSRSYTYYRCTGARGCRGTAIRGELLDNCLASLIQRISIDDKIKAWTEKWLETSLYDAFRLETSVLESLRQQLRQIEKRLQGALEMRLDGDLSKDEYGTEKVRLDQDRAELQRKLSAAENASSTVRTHISSKLKLLEQASSWHSMSVAAKRGFLRNFATAAFLTLDSVEFEVDEVTRRLVTFGLDESGTTRGFQSDAALRLSTWCDLRESIRTLGPDGVIPSARFAFPLYAESEPVRHTDRNLNQGREHEISHEKRFW